jgi:hypothetical protein
MSPITITITFFVLSVIALVISIFCKFSKRDDLAQYLLGVSLVLAVLALHGG